MTFNKCQCLDMSKQTSRTQITVRVSFETLERIEKLREHVEWETTFGPDINRADIIREAIRRGLDELEKEQDIKK